MRPRKWSIAVEMFAPIIAIYATLAIGQAVAEETSLDKIQKSTSVAETSGEKSEQYFGCWTKKHFDGRTVSGLTLCFLENGDLHGVDVHQGHGADFGGTWGIVEAGKLRINVGGGDETCSVDVSADRKTLTLEACSDVDLGGTFEKLPD
jgi:hypothetical protein